MTGVLGKLAVTSQAIVIGVRRNQSFGGRWTTGPSREQAEPVDLTEWSGVFRLTGTGGEVWLEKPLTLATHPEDPFVGVDLTAADTDAAIWQARTVGRYAFIMTKGDETRVLADGVARIQQGAL